MAEQSFRPKRSDPRDSVLTTMLLRTMVILAKQAPYGKHSGLVSPQLQGGWKTVPPPKMALCIAHMHLFLYSEMGGSSLTPELNFFLLLDLIPKI